MKKTISLILSVGMLLLGGCTPTSDAIKPDVETVVNNTNLCEEITVELSNPKYEGRLIGTKGNDDAAAYIKSKLQRMEIEPYIPGYIMPYSQVTADLTKQNPSVIVVFDNGEERKLEYGKDYFVNAASKDVECEIKLDAPRKTSSATVYTSGSTFAGEGILAGKSVPDGEIFASQDIGAVVGTPESGGSFKICLEEIKLESLITDGAKSVKVKVTAAPQNSYLKNVVGIIRGKKSVDAALVLTAHFDHVGKQGDFLFNGMFDNATGTAVLLSVADKLAKTVGKNTLDYDIIIAAVNSEETRGEESVCMGSGKLVELLSKNYEQIANINLDCFGLKTAIELEMGNPTPRTQPLFDIVKAEVDTAALKYNDSVYAASDHSSFERAGYPAMTVGGAYGASIEKIINAHSSKYVKEDFDFDMMEKTAQAVVNASVKANNAFVTQEQLQAAEENYANEAYAEVKNQLNGGSLKYGENIIVMVNGKQVKVGALGTELKTADEIKEHYPELKIPQTFSGYTYKSSQISDREVTSLPIEYEGTLPEGAELNKPYPIESDVNNVGSMMLSYKKDSNNMNLYIRKSPENPEAVVDKSNNTHKTVASPLENARISSYDGSNYYAFRFRKDGYDVSVSFHEDGASDKEMSTNVPEEEFLKLVEMFL